MSSMKGATYPNSVMFPQCVQSTHMHIPVDLTIKNPHHKALITACVCRFLGGIYV